MKTLMALTMKMIYDHHWLLDHDYDSGDMVQSSIMIMIQVTWSNHHHDPIQHHDYDSGDMVQSSPPNDGSSPGVGRHVCNLPSECLLVFLFFFLFCLFVC